MQEVQVQSLRLEDPLEEEVAPHSSILAWKIPWAEEPGGLQSIGSQRVGQDWATNTFKHINPDLLERDFSKLYFLKWKIMIFDQEGPSWKYKT